MLKPFWPADTFQKITINELDLKLKTCSRHTDVNCKVHRQTIGNKCKTSEGFWWSDNGRILKDSVQENK